MVKMEVIDVVVRELDKNEIILCKDSKGNWLHKDWCKLPYYEKMLGCPRFFFDCCNEPLLYDIAADPFILVGLKCDFKKYIDDMRLVYPDWSLRKLKTVIYWQRYINNVLKTETLKVIADYYKKGYRNLFYMDRPEIHGVFVIAMMLRMGYEIELKPNNIVWKIYLIGHNYKDLLKYRTLIDKDIREFF